jgi:DNA-binding NtrC family response regulator
MSSNHATSRAAAPATQCVSFFIVANSDNDACKALDAQQFDCITLDLGLGEHVGVDVPRYLSAVRCKAQIRRDQPTGQGRLRRRGGTRKSARFDACESVSKPMDLNALREILVRIQAQSPPPKPEFSAVTPGG